MLQANVSRLGGQRTGRGRMQRPGLLPGVSTKDVRADPTDRVEQRRYPITPATRGI